MIDACIEEGVQFLIYTNSESVVMSNRDFYMSDEDVPYPDEGHLLLNPYGVTKQRAEKLVLQAHGSALRNGNCFSSFILTEILMGRCTSQTIPSAKHIPPCGLAYDLPMPKHTLVWSSYDFRT